MVGGGLLWEPGARREDEEELQSGRKEATSASKKDRMLERSALA